MFNRISHGCEAEEGEPQRADPPPFINIMSHDAGVHDVAWIPTDNFAESPGFFSASQDHTAKFFRMDE